MMGSFVVVAGIAIIVVALGLTFAPSEVVSNVKDATLTALASVFGAIVFAVGLWHAAPDLLKRNSAAALRWLPNLPNSLKRRAVKNELEGEINAAFSQFGREGAGFIEHQIRIAWLTPDEDVADSFFREGKAYLKLNYSENNERNLVEAALLYCADGLLPATRQHLPKPLMRAIDLTFIDELLERRNAIHSRVYFTQEVLPRELAASPETEKYMDTLGLISQHGLFIRVLLPELRDYTGHAAPRLARQQHKEQIEAFIEFLGTTSRDRGSLRRRRGYCTSAPLFAPG